MPPISLIARLAAVFGGATWIPVRLAIGGAWGSTVLGLDYVAWNSLMVVPLGLMLLAAPLLLDVAPRGLPRVGVWLAVVGLAAMLAGVVVEFLVYGGLAGNPDGAVVGWLVYLLGIGLHMIGLGLVGAAIGRPVATIAALIGSLHALWFVSVILEFAPLLAIAQVLIGIGWISIGLLGRRAEARTAA